MFCRYGSKDCANTWIYLALFSNMINNNLQGRSAFRNILVHDYMRLDRTRVYQIIKDKTRYLEDLGTVFANML